MSVRVALVPSAFHPHLGGVEELSRQLAHELDRRSALAGVWTIRWPLELAADEMVEGLAVHRLRCVMPGRSAAELAMFPFRFAADVVRLARQFRTAGAEIVHVQCVSGQALYAWAAARLCGLPFVVSAQGELSMDATGLYQRSTLMPKVLRLVAGHGEAVTGCSRQTLDEVLDYLGRPASGHTEVVYNGVALAQLRAPATPGPTEPDPPGRPYLIALGRHVHQKGFDVLIEAFARTDAAATHDLVIAGDGSEHERLRELAQARGVAGSVHFPGRADRAQVARLLAGATLFVLPSRHEPMGIVNLEAMAAGAPVIATRVGGVPELVGEGDTGLLVPPDDASALAEAIDRLVGDPVLRARLVEAATAWVATFDWPVITDQYEQVYAAAVARSRSPVARLLRRSRRVRPSA